MKEYARKDDNTIEVVGVSSGAAGNAENYAEQVKFGGTRGHGFSAESANHLFDKFSGKDATIVGGNNAKNGADRLVDGVSIQTKYCKTGSSCVGECFEDGKYRYMNLNGTPMVIEVPYDKYDSAVQSMADRIKKGQVPTISDPAEAKNLVKKGSFSYEQARNIARFGTVESISYDAATGLISASSSFGISATIIFAVALWNGNDMKDALKGACKAGIIVGGVNWVAGIVTAQLGRTGAEMLLRGTTDVVTKQLGSKTASFLARGSGKAIYGKAATNHISKVMRGHLVAAAVVTLVISSVDIVRIFQGKISGAQLFKNVSKTASSVAGGAAGWMGGAALGATIGTSVPIVGTAVGAFIGGLLGSLAGGAAASYAASGILDSFIDDDADEMLDIIQARFSELAIDYLLTEAEAEGVVYEMQSDGRLVYKLQEMYQSDNRDSFADNILIPLIEKQVKNRFIISSSTSFIYIYVRNNTIKVMKFFVHKIASTKIYKNPLNSFNKIVLTPLVARVEILKYSVRMPKDKEILKAIDSVIEQDFIDLCDQV